MTMMSRFGAFAIAAAAFAATPSAAVTTVTFAQAFQIDPGAVVSHTGGTGGATLAASTPMTFSILDFAPGAPYVYPDPTTMTLAASSSAVIVDTGPQFEQ